MKEHQPVITGAWGELDIDHPILCLINGRRYYILLV